MIAALPPYRLRLWTAFFLYNTGGLAAPIRSDPLDCPAAAQVDRLSCLALRYIAPVIGDVGPMTVAHLLANAVDPAVSRREASTIMRPEVHQLAIGSRPGSTVTLERP
nr:MULTISPECIES: hypothetical protein [unclassified Bradyrhizobium]